MCFVQIANMKLFLIWFIDLAEQDQVHNFYNTCKLTNNLSSNFGLTKETMDLSRTLLAALAGWSLIWQVPTWQVSLKGRICQSKIVTFGSPSGLVLPILQQIAIFVLKILDMQSHS